MDSRKLRELLDACRPASGDLELPEMEPLREVIKDDPHWADAFEVAQRWERRMQKLCHEVVVPASLEERLLARLQARKPANDQAINSQRPSTVPVCGSLPKTRTGLRPWWRTALALAASVALVFAVSHFWRGTIDGTQLAQDAIQWSSSQLDQGAWSNQWEMLDREQHPMSRYVNAKPRGWQPLSVNLDRQGVAYRLTDPPIAHPPILLVLRTSAELSTADQRPPMRPNVDSGGVYCGVWREGPCLYALVVPGELHLYQNLTRSPWSVAAR